MISLAFRRVYFVCDKVIFRNVRSRGPNPGLNKRVKAFINEGLPLEEDVEEYIEESESDFLHVHDVHKMHEHEKKTQGAVLRRQIVKQKYFKEQLPNLLTWSEKEQIRHLHKTEPDEWTYERLAESFPITEAVAKKLIKQVWKPATEQRIARHDATAMRNWKELKEGTLDIPPELAKRFLKFSQRTIPPLKKESIKIDVNKLDNIGEFQAIINKCAAYEDSEEKTDKSNIATNEEDIRSSEGCSKTKQDKTRITLDELTNKIQKDLDSGKNVSLSDQIMISTGQSYSVSSAQEQIKDLEITTEEPKSLSNINSNEQDNKVIDYPDRIRIPKAAFKRGATYKVNDCFYDDDGRFLYRVIGIEN